MTSASPALACQEQRKELEAAFLLHGQVAPIPPHTVLGS